MIKDPSFSSFLQDTYAYIKPSIPQHWNKMLYLFNYINCYSFVHLRFLVFLITLAAMRALQAIAMTSECELKSLSFDNELDVQVSIEENHVLGHRAQQLVIFQGFS